MKIVKTKRKKNSLLVYKRDSLRNSLLVIGRNPNLIFLNSTFNNPFWMYKVISIPVANGTYKIKICSKDDLDNMNTGVEGSVVVSYFVLPPKNVAVTSSGNTITLTWEESTDGEPDSYVIYSNNGSGNVNKVTPLDTVLGSVLTYSKLVANGSWKFIVEAKKNGVESDTRNVVSVDIPLPVPPKPGIPKGVTGLCLERISIGKVKVSFIWPYGTSASSFNIYHDDGTGTISYTSPKFTFSRQSTLVQAYTTTKLHSLDENIQYKFVVRAVNSDGVEETNTDEYLIEVDGVAPDNAEDLVLETIF